MAKQNTIRIAVVVGNGFTLDFVESAGFRVLRGTPQLTGPIEVADAIKWVNRPLDWPLQLPRQLHRAFREALPAFHAAVDRLREIRPEASHFNLLRVAAGPLSERDSSIDIETRHFLSYAYRAYTRLLETRRIDDWPWARWFQTHAASVVTTVSFNYDCLLERVLAFAGRTYTRHNGARAQDILVFKPHGSCDFDTHALSRQSREFPVRVFAHLSNVIPARGVSPIRIIPHSEWDLPPFEPLTVLPYERNPYLGMYWVWPGFVLFERHASSLTHCIFAGLSCDPADRPEIDRLLHATPQSCKIVVANRFPDAEHCRAFRDFVARTGRQVEVWPDGPTSLHDP
jgi:hypothetical protein